MPKPRKSPRTDYDKWISRYYPISAADYCAAGFPSTLNLIQHSLRK